MSIFYINGQPISWDIKELENSVKIKGENSSFTFPSEFQSFNFYCESTAENKLPFISFTQEGIKINDKKVLTEDNVSLQTNDNIITTISGMNIQGQVKIEFQGNKLILTKMF